VPYVNSHWLICDSLLKFRRKNRQRYEVSLFFKTHVLSVKRNKTEVPKNKVFKPHVLNMFLTLNYLYYFFLYFQYYFKFKHPMKYVKRTIFIIRKPKGVGVRG
jgi:hypothetical protein